MVLSSWFLQTETLPPRGRLRRPRRLMKFARLRKFRRLQNSQDSLWDFKDAWWIIPRKKRLSCGESPRDASFISCQRGWGGSPQEPISSPSSILTCVTSVKSLVESSHQLLVHYLGWIGVCSCFPGKGHASDICKTTVFCFELNSIAQDSSLCICDVPKVQKQVWNLNYSGISEKVHLIYTGLWRHCSDT